MSEVTYGAARDRLIENGYCPASALAPFVTVVSALGPSLQNFAYRIAEDPAAILCSPDFDAENKEKVVALIVTAREKTLRASINGVIEKLGLASGPVRSGADGSEHRPLRFDEYHVFMTRCWRPFGWPRREDPPVIAELAESIAPGHPLISGVIRLDGDWRGGDLLTTPRAKLPAIDRDRIDALFRELDPLRTAEPEPRLPLQLTDNPYRSTIKRS